MQSFSQGSIHFLNFRELISCQQFCEGLDHIYHMSTAQFLCKIWLSDVGIHTPVIDLPSCKYVKSLRTWKHSYILIIRQRKNRNPVIPTHEKKLKAYSMRKAVIQINVHGRKSSNQLISFPCGTTEYSAHGLSCRFCSEKKKNPVKVLFQFRISCLRNFPSNCPLISGQPDQWVKIS